MALREVTYYIATCDFPGCDAEAEYGDYTAMGDPVSAIEMAEEGDWHAGAKPKECYCPKHPVVHEDYCAFAGLPLSVHGALPWPAAPGEEMCACQPQLTDRTVKERST